MSEERGAPAERLELMEGWGGVSLVLGFDLGARHFAARKDRGVNAFWVQAQLLETVKSTGLFPSLAQGEGESHTQTTSSSPKEPT